jgi:hypothetical protein
MRIKQSRQHPCAQFDHVGWERRATEDARKFFAEGSRHLVLPGTKVLKINNKSVEIDCTHPDFGKEIYFDALVYSTVRASRLCPYPPAATFRRSDMPSGPGVHIFVSFPPDKRSVHFKRNPGFPPWVSRRHQERVQHPHRWWGTNGGRVRR